MFKQSIFDFEGGGGGWGGGVRKKILRKKRNHSVTHPPYQQIPCWWRCPVWWTIVGCRWCSTFPVHGCTNLKILSGKKINKMVKPNKRFQSQGHIKKSFNADFLAFPDPLWPCIKVKVINMSLSIYMYLYVVHKSTVMPSFNAIVHSMH